MDKTEDRGQEAEGRGQRRQRQRQRTGGRGRGRGRGQEAEDRGPRTKQVQSECCLGTLSATAYLFYMHISKWSIGNKLRAVKLGNSSRQMSLVV